MRVIQVVEAMDSPNVADGERSINQREFVLTLLIMMQPQYGGCIMINIYNFHPRRGYISIWRKSPIPPKPPWKGETGGQEVKCVTKWRISPPETSSPRPF